MTEFRRPPFLKQGDRIHIVAPANRIDPEYLNKAQERLEEEGLVVTISKHADGSHFRFSGTDEERLIDLQEALSSPDIAAILCARGGYGSSRIADKLDFTEFLNRPKWLVGFSDISVLHTYLQTHVNTCSIHGTVPLAFQGEAGEQSVISILNCLFGNPDGFNDIHSPFNRSGHAEAPLVGGNLAVLTGLLGTPAEVRTENTILFFEDVGEYLYRIDRMLQQWRLAGKFDSIKGLVLGGLTDMRDGDPPFGQSIEEIILDCVPQDIPVLFNLPVGHIPLNKSLMLGGHYTLKINDDKIGSLTFQSSDY